MLENASGRHYTGITTDPVRRLLEHNAGSTASTRGFRPWKMIHTEEFDSRSKACKREWHLKHSKGQKDKLDIIEKHRTT
jgi:putative endonuclease